MRKNPKGIRTPDLTIWSRRLLYTTKLRTLPRVYSKMYTLSSPKSVPACRPVIFKSSKHKKKLKESHVKTRKRILRSITLRFAIRGHSSGKNQT